MESKLVEQLKRDEGEVLHVYQDHLGYWTIGVGRLVDRRRGGGISKDEAAYLLKNDIEKFQKEVSEQLPWFKHLDEARQGALINMAFQMGTNGLLGFKASLSLIRQGLWQQAHDQLLTSKWAQQTPNRAARIAKQILTGEWQ